MQNSMNPLIFCKAQDAKQELSLFLKTSYNPDELQLCHLLDFGELVISFKLPEVSKSLDSSSKRINETMHIKCSAHY